MNRPRDMENLIHEHVYLGDHHDGNARRTNWVVALTAVMMVGEIIAGMAFNSMALLADGFHMATHAAALGLAAAAYAYARRHATSEKFSFGTGKVGDLAGFASALVLAVVSLGILVESTMRVFAPRDVAFDQAIIVAVLGLAVNVVSALLLAGGHHDAHHGHDHHGNGRHHHHDHHSHGGSESHGDAREHDNNLQAAFAHVVTDALTSVLAIVALLGGRFFGLAWLDPAMGIVGAVVIAIWSWKLMQATAFVLLDGSDPELAEEVRAEVEGPGDALITDLHVWRVGPGAYAAIVSFAGDLDPEAVRARLTPVHELVHVTVERCQPAPARA